MQGWKMLAVIQSMPVILFHVLRPQNRLDAVFPNRRSMTPEEKRRLIASLRQSWTGLGQALEIAERHQSQWPELAAELDQSLTRLTRHLALAEALRLKGEQ